MDATVRNFPGQFYPRGLWKLGSSSIISNEDSEDKSITAGNAIFNGGGTGCSRCRFNYMQLTKFCKSVAQGGILNCDVAIMKNILELPFERWNVVPATLHDEGKDKAQAHVGGN